MVQIATVRPIVLSQGQAGGIVWWTYNDIDGGNVITPVNPTCKLFDVNNVQRDPSNTANTSAATFIPSFDTTGAVTGTVGAAYITIALMASQAAIGLWYIETSFTWESVPSTLGIGFNVAVGGATVGGPADLGTVPVYAFHKDVENILLTIAPFDRNNLSDKIDNYIVMAEGEFEARTGKAYKPRFETNELLDIETYRQKRADTFFNQAFTKRPIKLAHGPILPFDSTRGHKIELYRGSEAPLDVTGADPVRRWDDLVQLRYGRSDGDYWFDENGGGIFIRNTLMVRTGRSVRVTYEWGKPITTLTSPAVGQPSTIYVRSTHRYEARGVIRIGRTYIFHTGKTGNSFTGCQWGVLGTQAEDYVSGSEVYEVPQDVRQAITLRAASMFLQNEIFVAVTGDNAGTAPKFSDKIKDWDERWEYFISHTNQRWSNF